MNTDTRTLPVDAMAIYLDETRHYNIAAEDRPFIEKIIGVYVLDTNEHTYCCEITPSHWCEHVYDSVVTTYDTPDDVRDRLDEQYAHCGSDGMYLHVSSVDRLPTDQKRTYGVCEDLDEAREYFQGNCPF